MNRERKSKSICFFAQCASQLWVVAVFCCISIKTNRIVAGPQGAQNCSANRDRTDKEVVTNKHAIQRAMSEIPGLMSESFAVVCLLTTRCYWMWHSWRIGDVDVLFFPVGQTCQQWCSLVKWRGHTAHPLPQMLTYTIYWYIFCNTLQHGNIWKTTLWEHQNIFVIFERFFKVKLFL